jgi:hypothetical protein
MRFEIMRALTSVTILSALALAACSSESGEGKGGGGSTSGGNNNNNNNNDADAGSSSSNPPADKEGKVCADQAACGDGYLCIYRGGDQAGTCRTQCTSWSDCKAFYKCCVLSNVSTSACMPGDQVPEGANCN